MSYIFWKLCDQGRSWHRNFFFTLDSNQTLIWHCLTCCPRDHLVVTPSEILNRKVAFFSGYERESQNISIDKNNIFSVQFCSSVIEAEPFSIPAAASGTKASPKSKIEIKCYGKSDKCNLLCINCMHRYILTSDFVHLTRSVSLLFSRKLSAGVV